jgi:hypothetical protein
MDSFLIRNEKDIAARHGCPQTQIQSVQHTFWRLGCLQNRTKRCLCLAEISAKNENGRRCPGDVLFMISHGLLIASLFTRLSGMPREPLCSVALRDTKRHGRRGHGKSASSFQAGAEKQLATLDLWCPQGAIYSLALHDKHKVSYFLQAFLICGQRSPPTDTHLVRCP